MTIMTMNCMLPYCKIFTISFSFGMGDEILDDSIKQQEEDLVRSLNLNMTSPRAQAKPALNVVIPTTYQQQQQFANKQQPIGRTNSPILSGSPTKLAATNNNAFTMMNHGYTNNGSPSLPAAPTVIATSTAPKNTNVYIQKKTSFAAQQQQQRASTMSPTLFSNSPQPYSMSPQLSSSPMSSKPPHQQEAYLQKLSQQSPAQQQAFQFRKLYLDACDKQKIAASQDLLRALKNHIRSTATPFTRLAVCHAQLDDNHVKIIVQALKQAKITSLNEILFNHNLVSDMGASLLAKCLVSNHECFVNISSLELFGNQMGDECCKDLALMIKQNAMLKRLKLGDNKIGPVGASYLAEGLQNNTSLTQLHMGGNKIKFEGLQKLSELSLMNNTTLTSLGLRDNDVGAEGMKALAQALVQPTCALSDIQLKGNQINPQGAAYLAQALYKNQSLKVLELQSNAIGPAGVQALCTALQQNRSVHALNFNDNELGCDGAAFVATLLMKNPSITTLGLANNRIRKKGATALAASLGPLSELSKLNSANDSGSPVLLNPPSFEQPNSLDLHLLVAVTGLDLGNNELGNSGAVALAQSLKHNTVLTSLDLRSCEIHLKGILALAEMASFNTTLRHLDLGSNYAKNAGAQAFAKVLSQNKSLTRLCLTDNQIYHEGGEALAIGLQSNYTLRNFSYGGQGSAANRVDSQIRRIIDSIVNENKKHWEMHQNSGIVPTSYNSNNHHRFINIPQTVSRMRVAGSDMDESVLDSPQSTSPLSMSPTTTNPPIMFPNNNSLSTTPPSITNSPLLSASNLQDRSRYSASPISQSPIKSALKNAQANALPSWFTNTTTQQFYLDSAKLDHRLEFLFLNKLLKAENPKFPGCYFIGNILNTLRKVFPDTPRNLDEVELVRFAYHNSKYHVHISREMVKTQIKYVVQQQQQPAAASPQQQQSWAYAQHYQQQQQPIMMHSPTTTTSNMLTNTSPYLIAAQQQQQQAMMMHQQQQQHHASSLYSTDVMYSSSPKQQHGVIAAKAQAVQYQQPYMYWGSQE